MTAPIRVVLADDQALVRAGFRSLLDAQDDIEVVGEASSGDEAVGLASELSPDVVLMDIRMPGMDGLGATRAIAAGADGFLLKDTPPADIVQAIHKVAEGEAMLSPSVARTLIQRIRDDSLDDRAVLAEARLATLTDRERDVALAVGRGLSNAEIAGELYLSVPTVKAYVSRLFEKLGATNRVQIAICVHDAGLA